MIAETSRFLRPRKTPHIALSVLSLSQKAYKSDVLLLSYPPFTHPDNEHSDGTSY